ncbi:alpha/beta hydrolase [Rhodococcus rhodnii]|nr:alpha/beta hydrolase [Rhodococcus rhodnii]TXG91346.1 alpha/beta hydrolase [Rhodococcus rhodnii]
MLAALDSGFPDVTAHTPQQMRELVGARRGPASTEPPMRSVENTRVPGGPAVRVYRPESDGVLPVVVFAHGGGFVFCDLDSHDGLCRELAQRVGAVVVSVDYRLAPEHPGPAAADDVSAALDWAHARAADWGGDPDRLVLAGDSAGGNLAACAAIATVRRGGPVVAAQLLIYPVIDDDFDSESYRTYGSGYYNTEAAMRWYWSHYAPGGARDETVAPSRAPSLAGVAPAVVVTAEFDPLCDSGHRYAQQLADAGIPVRTHRFDGLFHGFLAFPTLSHVGPALDRIAGLTRDVLGVRDDERTTR